MLNAPAPARIAPAALLTPSRLDLVAKFLLFRSLIDRAAGGVCGQALPGDRAQALYERHIARRTGGFEDRKSSVAHYVSSARALLDRLRSTGFDPATPVRIGERNGLPLDGAHRIAACLALGIDVAAVHVEDGWGGTWGYDWFRANGFDQDDLDLIVRTYCRLSGRVIAFVFWGPTRDRWDVLLNGLSADARIVASSDVAVEPSDLATVVEDLYAWRLGPTPNARIQQKARILGAGPAAVRVVIAEAPSGGSDLSGFSAALKRKLRTAATGCGDDFWTTVHATDASDETRYVADLLFNQNYLRMLALRRGVSARATFLGWLERYVATLDGAGIPREDACIVGSAVLEVIGVRESTDVDCIVGAREPRFHAGVVKLGEGVDLVTRGYHRRADGAATFSDAEVIADPTLHFHARGLKFANPELVIDRKRQHQRPKDLADVALWERRNRAVTAPPAAERAVVLVTSRPIDARRRAQLEDMTRAHALAGTALIVVGSVVAPASLSGPYIEIPPGAGELPVHLFTDPDPGEVLTTLGADPPALMAAEAARSGAPRHAGEAFERLRGLAWTARWARSWLDVIRPAEVLVDDRDVLGMLVRAVAAGTPAAAPPFDVSVLAAACRTATEQSRLVRAASEQTSTASHAVRDREAMRAALDVERQFRRREACESAWWRAAADAHRRPLWIWGAGAGGRRAVAWLSAAGAPVAGVVDSDTGKHGTLLGGLVVASPSVLASRDSSVLRIAIASVRADVIAEAARRLGLRSAQISVLEGDAPALVDTSPSGVIDGQDLRLAAAGGPVR